MSSNNVNHPVGAVPNGILQERLPNVPATVTTRPESRRSTASTLSHSSHHVQFDQDLIGQIDRTSLLALAYMPPHDSDEEDGPPPGPTTRYQTAMEEEHEHDLNDLADYNGDSDDEGPSADTILANLETFNQQCFADTAVAHEDGFTTCDNMLSEDDHFNEQDPSRRQCYFQVRQLDGSNLVPQMIGKVQQSLRLRLENPTLTLNQLITLEGGLHLPSDQNSNTSTAHQQNTCIT